MTVSIIKIWVVGLILIFAISGIITVVVITNPGLYTKYIPHQNPGITVIENITTLVNKSDFIVVGTAVGITHTSVISGTNQTMYLFNVTEDIKGTIPLDHFITITQVNGYNGTLIDPPPVAGYGYVLFLQNDSNVLSTVGGPQGRFVVYNYDGSVDIASLNYYYPQDSWIALQYEGMPLNQFVSVIRAVGG